MVHSMSHTALCAQASAGQDIARVSRNARHGDFRVYVSWGARAENGRFMRGDYTVAGHAPRSRYIMVTCTLQVDPDVRNTRPGSYGARMHWYAQEIWVEIAGGARGDTGGGDVIEGELGSGCDRRGHWLHQ